MQFLIFAAVFSGACVPWVFNFWIVVWPPLSAHDDGTICDGKDAGLRRNTLMLFIYFAWFAVARVLLLVPCVAARVIQAQIQPSTSGFCRSHSCHAVFFDGPLYLFTMGTGLFWFHVIHLHRCLEDNPDIGDSLKPFAGYNVAVTLGCCVLAYRHSLILGEVARSLRPDDPVTAAKKALEALELRPYGESTLGACDGWPFPAECAICLAQWEPDDAIRVTPCRHAFHEECIGGWLRSARTCALCRQDLMSQAGAVYGSGAGLPEVLPAGPRAEPPAEPLGDPCRDSVPPSGTGEVPVPAGLQEAFIVIL